MGFKKVQVASFPSPRYEVNRRAFLPGTFPFVSLRSMFVIMKKDLQKI